MELFGTSPAGTTNAAAPIRLAVGRNVLESCGCTRALAQTLLLRPDGRPFAPVQLMQPHKNATPATWAQLMQFLMSPRPIGGYEDTVNANKAVAIERAMNALSDRLAGIGAGTSISYVQLLTEARDAALEEKAAVESDGRALRERFAKADERIRKYQDESVRRAGRSLSLSNLLKAIAGDTVSLPEAIKAFNDREFLAAQTAAHSAAGDVLGQIVALCEQLLGGLEATHLAALAGVQAARTTANDVARLYAGQGRIADYVVAHRPIIELICAPDSDAAFMPDLIAEARVNGGANIAAKARELAERDVKARLDGLDILGLIRLEAMRSVAGGEPISPSDAPLTIANHLVEVVRRTRPGIKLAPNAKPLSFVLQIASSERPPFNHPGLTAARYRKPTDELAFMRIDTDLALHDLLVMQDGEVELLDALAHREFFVLEELAEQWRRKAAQRAAARAPARAPAIRAAASHDHLAPDVESPFESEAMETSASYANGRAEAAPPLADDAPEA